MIVHSNDLFAQVYAPVFHSVMQGEKERYTFTGGRASCKSSFISLLVVILIVMVPQYNALILRKTAKNLRRSVFEQIVWAIDKLHLRSRFKIPKSQTSALPITYTRKDGRVQYIIFTGCDDPEKVKSIKVANGYFAILWIEEKTEFTENELHNIKISALRGGKQFYIFESFNPPSAARHWCNKELLIDDPKRMIVHTTYLDIPKDWLGDAILYDIEMTKRNNPRAYENIYLGEATGTGKNIFENVELREITDAEIDAFDFLYFGIDWGYFPDPFAFGIMSFDTERQTLYVFDELYLYKHGNFEAFKALQNHLEEKNLDIGAVRITADSAEPKSVKDFRTWGANVRGAVKGIGSLDAGFKWLQGLAKIVIDPARCPKATDEFTLYEYEIDKKTGELLSGYPQGQPDHYLALTRYALETVWRHAGE